MFVVWSATKHILFVSKPLNLVGCHGNQNCEKYSKTNSEAISGMKLKLCRNVYSINRYKNIVFFFYCCCLCSLVAMATKSFHRLRMGKMKIGFSCCLIAGNLTEFFSEFFVEFSPP